MVSNIPIQDTLLLEVTKDEIIGKNYKEIWGQTTQSVYQILHNVYLTGIPAESIHVVFIRKDGSQRDIEASISLVRNEKGNPIGFRGIARDITERKRAEETLRTLSLNDDLTGLYNRRGFLALAEQELKMANRMKRGMFLLFADLDCMKKITDLYGHQEGDRALIAVADIIKNTYRDPDIIARTGGDEFVILAIEGTSESSAENLRGRLNRNLELFNGSRKRPHTLSLSMGVVRYNPDRPVSIEELIAEADQGMYEEKRWKRLHKLDNEQNKKVNIY